MASPRPVSLRFLVVVLGALGACSAAPAADPGGTDEGAAGGSGVVKGGGGAGGTNGTAKAGGAGGRSSPATGGAGEAAGGGPGQGGAGGSDETGGGAGGSSDAGADTGGGAPADAGGAPPGAGASPACAAGAMVPAPDGYQTVMTGGKQRKFLVRAPKSYDGKKPLALVFALHGGGANGMSFETRIAAIRTAIGERAIFVYPDGLPEKGGMITWARDYKDDLGFMDAILAWSTTQLCYDTSRVFALGQSSGAYFANTIGCHRGDVFRAVGSNGGGYRAQEFMGCTGHAAAWISNGAADTSHLPDARKARDQWVMINGCTMANPTKVEPAPCVSYTGCKSGFPVHYCENSGGHDIPAYMPMGLADFFFSNFDK